MSTTPPNRTAEHPDWGQGWGVGLRAWVERAGQAVIGPEQLEILEAIDRSRGSSAGLEEGGIPNAWAWNLAQAMTGAEGEPLVTPATGGVPGGGARLTPLGRWAMAGFRALRGNLPQTAASLVPRLGE